MQCYRSRNSSLTRVRRENLYGGHNDMDQSFHWSRGDACPCFCGASRYLSPQSISCSWCYSQHLSPLLSSLPIVFCICTRCIACFFSPHVLPHTSRRTDCVLTSRVHKDQQQYHDLYTPLTALTNIRRALDEYEQGTNAPTVTIQEEQVSILDLVQQQERIS